ncbi:NAD-dependent epimerase/dehydratase family protein [Paracoccus sediminilitoris]|uniref:NAD-dependent epimerase/dehydratase family protein n=1 Tax=Paracoccus sediminilitoris TaxID=2202419 RepID=UPI00272C1B58|nr:NAD(P)-dependent oxidoreductase [Paracoccus sediminilitoris]
MKFAVTGATGFVGHHIVDHLIRSDHDVLTLGRRPSRHDKADFMPFDLDRGAPDLRGQDVLVHAALSHVPGHYRGGEGDAPETFLRRNLEGTIRLFAAARDAGVPRILFLSSRAVYGDYPPGTILHEDLPPRPDTLYGEVKLRAEIALARMASADLAVASLRATGVCGLPVPGLAHKWAQLLQDYAQGRPIAPRVATEVHSHDLAEAVRIIALAPPEALAPMVFNISGMVVDRRDMLAQFARLCGISHPLPLRADPGKVNVMETGRLQRLGWHASGTPQLHDILSALLPR